MKSPEKPAKDEWLEAYSRSHQHRVNRWCHLIGIPLVTLAPLLFVLVIFDRDWWPLPVAVLVVGWILQFVGHAFEGKAPEFFKDWRFLLVGFRWWIAKIRGER